MFSGKTEELIRRVKRAVIANQQVKLFKHKIDQRYSSDDVVSHNKNAIPSIPINNATEIKNYIDNISVIGIDEAQFFDDSLITVCSELANMGKRVIVAGLDMDYQGEPFGPMPKLLATADFITKVHAICIKCGNLAQYTHRKTDNNNKVLLGEKKTYESLCRNCFNSVLK